MGSRGWLRRRIVVVAAGAAGIAAATAPPAHADPPNSTPPVGIAIDEHGYAIGIAQLEGNSKVGVWNPAGQFTYLQTTPNDQSDWAYTINDHGVIAGSRLDTGYTSHPALWNRSGQLTDLPAGSEGGTARGINNRNVAVGDLVSNGRDVPVEWSEDAQIIYLPLPSDATYGEAWAINKRGVVLGHVASSYPGRSLLWCPDGRTVDLATPSGDMGTFPLAINDDGVSVGFAIGPQYQTYPVRWTRDGQVTVLSTAQGRASSINNAGVTVGSIVDSNTGVDVATQWSPDGQQTPLPLPPNSFVSDANGINDRGDIVGDITTYGGSSAVEWAPNGQLTYLK